MHFVPHDGDHDDEHVGMSCNIWVIGEIIGTKIMETEMERHFFPSLLASLQERNMYSQE